MTLQDLHDKRIGFRSLTTKKLVYDMLDTLGARWRSGDRMADFFDRYGESGLIIDSTGRVGTATRVDFYIEDVMEGM